MSLKAVCCLCEPNVNAPNIVMYICTGGSIVAAWICTATDDEMQARLLPGAIKMDPFEQLSVGSVRRKVWLSTGVFENIIV